MSYHSVLENRKMDSLSQFSQGYNKNYLEYTLKIDSVKQCLSDLDTLLLLSERIVTLNTAFDKVVAKATNAELSSFLDESKILFTQYTTLYDRLVSTDLDLGKSTKNPYADIVNQFVTSVGRLSTQIVHQNCVKTMESTSSVSKKISLDSDKGLKQSTIDFMGSVKETVLKKFSRFSKTASSELVACFESVILESLLLETITDEDSPFYVEKELNKGYQKVLADDLASSIVKNVSKIDKLILSSSDKDGFDSYLGEFVILSKLSGRLNYLSWYGKQFQT